MREQQHATRSLQNTRAVDKVNLLLENLRILQSKSFGPSGFGLELRSGQGLRMGTTLQHKLLSTKHIKTIITTAEVLLRDLFDDTIITIVKELQRRLPPAIFDFIGQREDKEGTGVRLEAQTS
ncbi:hypothetical protein L2E82_04018 [Cichorium intybus]|uniref:Uncharacterized protein n=1 Tax=Cichorium intybus TaxID=13427 RepID=A0ACB9H6E6_CICIN|nr:hypothetical protein L2E82_04018 [Cichorium intybus]